MRILITGGAGFIGSHLAQAACTLGHTVHIVDNLICGRRENVPQGASLHVTDIIAPGVETLIAELQPDAIGHLAAQITCAPRSPSPSSTPKSTCLGPCACCMPRSAMG